MDRINKQFQRQISFLKNSCGAFDSGNMEEAIRIATSIRVLVHDTGKSTSLLKHLGVSDFNLISVKPEVRESEPGIVSVEGFAMGQIRVGGANSGYGPIPAKDVVQIKRTLPLNEWWNEIIWKFSVKDRITRKILILTAANQDGGAHVDAELEGSYKKLSEEIFGTLTHGALRMSLRDMHLVAIRTVANELLESPDMINLIKRSSKGC